ncbi:uncharacterized protein [Epargyreus clarus]|uniref:uncharacterized protein n=1 Tax=Epargyreus clarus TaxID=520877 RepID=UPI003C2E8AC0
MELVSLAKDVLQNVAEHGASYRLGQTTLKYLDRALWTVEKCARWAVPPPLDQDERPQPELVRPLPWVFFLALLVALRVTRESISLINLVLGKPPLRSADVVTYIQGKRRYLRTLKYQGNRMMRSRSEVAPRQSWFSSIQTLLEFTMCFRRHPQHYGNNNTTRLSNNDEVLVVKRNKHGGHEASPLPAAETTMERLIEKIMVDLDADSDEDSSYTLTTVTSVKSDQSGYNTESEDTAIQMDTSTLNRTIIDATHDVSDSPRKNNSFTPENNSFTPENNSFTPENNSFTPEYNSFTPENNSFTPDSSLDGVQDTSTPEKKIFEDKNTSRNDESKIHSEENGNASGKDALINIIRSEKASPQKNQIPRKQKIANGRATTSPQGKERISSGKAPY